MDTLDELVGARSSSGGTSLVTLHVPAGANVAAAAATLIREQCAAQHIKDKGVRADTLAALKAAHAAMADYSAGRVACPNGLVVCAGRVGSGQLV